MVHMKHLMAQWISSSICGIFGSKTICLLCLVRRKTWWQDYQCIQVPILKHMPACATRSSLWHKWCLQNAPESILCSGCGRMCLWHYYGIQATTAYASAPSFHAHSGAQFRCSGGETQIPSTKRSCSKQVGHPASIAWSHHLLVCLKTVNLKTFKRFSLSYCWIHTSMYPTAYRTYLLASKSHFICWSMLLGKYAKDTSSVLCNLGTSQSFVQATLGACSLGWVILPTRQGQLPSQF